MAGRVVVTGAFSFSGRYIAQRLLAAGKEVVTLTSRLGTADPLAARIEAHRLDFARPDELARAMTGADVLYNTYWSRFGRENDFDGLVANTTLLVQAAVRAGVRRIVHISIASASAQSPFGYYRAKAAAEQAVKETGLSYAILRPTLLFGPEDIMVNNIAWFLRHLPVFGILGDGEYQLQPVYVDDLAAQAVAAGEGETNEAFDVAGPECFTFNEFIRMIRKACGGISLVTHLPLSAVLAANRVLGLALGDVTLTAQEAEALMANLLVSSEPQRGTTSFIDWVTRQGRRLGEKYRSSQRREYR